MPAPAWPKLLPFVADLITLARLTGLDQPIAARAPWEWAMGVALLEGGAGAEQVRGALLVLEALNRSPGELVLLAQQLCRPWDGVRRRGRPVRAP